MKKKQTLRVCRNGYLGRSLRIDVSSTRTLTRMASFTVNAQYSNACFRFFDPIDLLDLIQNLVLVSCRISLSKNDEAHPKLLGHVFHLCVVFCKIHWWQHISTVLGSFDPSFHSLNEVIVFHLVKAKGTALDGLLGDDVLFDASA